MKKILLTSFTTWLPHQLSNSSNDLLDEIAKVNYTHLSLDFIKLLPVDLEVASQAVITKINTIAPDIIICCGMAEGRHQLSIESNATRGNIVMRTNVALEKLVDGVDRVNISHDAGKFVCEALYYSVLNYIFEQKLNTSCIFVHVPILSENNFAAIVEDFVLLIQRIAQF